MNTGDAAQNKVRTTKAPAALTGSLSITPTQPALTPESGHVVGAESGADFKGHRLSG